MFGNDLIEDSKVIGSATFAVVLDLAQVCNQFLTLLISLMTLVYVAGRAYQTIRTIFPVKNKKRRKRKC